MLTGTTSNQRPSKGSLTGRVWEIADAISKETGRTARRGEVIDRFVAEGGNANTASTQFHHWKTSQQHPRNEKPPTPQHLQSVPRQRLNVGLDGRLLIPQAMREAMMLEPDGVVTVSVEDGELRVISPRAGVLRAQALVRSLVPDDVSLVDELIADRRAEAAREAE